MANPIFDSKSEEQVFRRLDSVWSKYIDVYPQIPVRKVLGYFELMDLEIKDGAKDYLMKTEFDFVVCERGSGRPFLAVEFDGIGHGYSKRGEYLLVEQTDDPHRKLKIDAKLHACDLVGFPIVVVSFPETELLDESGSLITVLDGRIAEVRSALGMQNLIAANHDVLSRDSEDDSPHQVENMTLWELEFQSDMENNPLRRKAAEIFRQLHHSCNFWQPLRDRTGYVGVRKGIYGAIGSKGHKMLVKVDVYIRDQFNASNAVDCIAEYCLARKAMRELGADPVAWQQRYNATPWIAFP